jgi:hypothetical protein
MKRVIVLVVGAAVGTLFACSSGSTGGTTGDGGTSEGGTSGSSGGGSTTIDLTGLDTACTTTADCVAVVAGDACAICMCASQVIAKKAQAAYDAKFEAARSACGPRPAIACAADCAQVAFSCSAAGKCVLGITADGG